MNIKELIQKIRISCYGIDVREAIASGFEGMVAEEEKHKEEISLLVDNHASLVNQVLEKFDRIIASGTENPNMLEIVEARGEYKSLLERLNAEQLKDILVGLEANRKFKAFDDLGELLGTIDNTGIYFNSIEAGYVNSPSIIGVVEGGTYHIDNSTASTYSLGGSEKTFNSLSECVAYFKNKVINGNLTINIKAGIYNEHVYIENILGSGKIVFNLENGVVINGGLYFYGLNKQVFINGNNAIVNHGAETTMANGAIYVENCTFVNIALLQVIGINNISDWGIIAYNGGNVRVDRCNISGFNHWGSALSCQGLSKLVAIDCVGENNNKSVHALNGGVVVASGKIPHASTQGNNDTTSTITTNGAVMSRPNTSSDTPIAPPNTENPTTTYTVNASKVASWCGNYGWDLTVGSYKHKLYQGKYYSSYPDTWNWRGYIGYTRADIANVINGKEIVGAKILLARKSVGGDYSTVKVRLYGTTSTGTGSAPSLNFDYGYVAVIKKGESIWVDLPQLAITHIKNNNIAGFVLYHPTNNGEVVNYAIFEDTTGKLQLTVR